MFLEALIVGLQVGLALLSLALCVGLFWHMRRIGKTGLANVWWLLAFVSPLPFLAMELTAQDSSEYFVLTGVAAVWLLIGIAARFVNPLDGSKRGVRQ